MAYTDNPNQSQSMTPQQPAAPRTRMFRRVIRRPATQMQQGPDQGQQGELQQQMQRQTQPTTPAAPPPPTPASAQQNQQRFQQQLSAPAPAVPMRPAAPPPTGSNPANAAQASKQLLTQMGYPPANAAAPGSIASFQAQALEAQRRQAEIARTGRPATTMTLASPEAAASTQQQLQQMVEAQRRGAPSAGSAASAQDNMRRFEEQISGAAGQGTPMQGNAAPSASTSPETQQMLAAMEQARRGTIQVTSNPQDAMREMQEQLQQPVEAGPTSDQDALRTFMNTLNGRSVPATPQDEMRMAIAQTGDLDLANRLVEMRRKLQASSGQPSALNDVYTQLTDAVQHPNAAVPRQDPALQDLLRQFTDSVSGRPVNEQEQIQTAMRLAGGDPGKARRLLEMFNSQSSAAPMVRAGTSGIPQNMGGGVADGSLQEALDRFAQLQQQRLAPPTEREALQQAVSLTGDLTTARRLLEMWRRQQESQWDDLAEM